MCLNDLLVMPRHRRPELFEGDATVDKYREAMLAKRTAVTQQDKTTKAVAQLVAAKRTVAARWTVAAKRTVALQTQKEKATFSLLQKYGKTQEKPSNSVQPNLHLPTQKEETETFSMVDLIMPARYYVVFSSVDEDLHWQLMDLKTLTCLNTTGKTTRGKNVWSPGNLHGLEEEKAF